MKKMPIAIFAVVLPIALTFCAYANEGQITIRVTDEVGNAVADAQAVAQFENLLPPGEGWGSGRPTEVKGLTDTNGSCTLSGSATGGTVAVGVQKEGYYYGKISASFTNSLTNRWLPWDPTVGVILEKKGAQVPMYAKKVEEIKIPVEGSPVGFDLVEGDWVAPYGKGKTDDFIIFLEKKPVTWITNWYGTSPRPYSLRDDRMTLSFSNDGDGIQSATAKPYGIRLSRRSPDEGYEPMLVKTQHDEIVGMVQKNTKVQHDTNLDKRQNYFFRIRTKKDAQGNIVSALYGKIYGEFNDGVGVGDRISFTYYLNPIPNSHNMEFDPGQNLFNGLPFSEQVREP